MTTPDADAEGPAERALEARLEDVRSLPPEVDPQLAAAIVRTARWQRAVRAPLVLAGMLSRAAADGLGVLIGFGKGPRA
jgi:hypothetical protein